MEVVPKDCSLAQGKPSTWANSNVNYCFYDDWRITLVALRRPLRSRLEYLLSGCTALDTRMLAALVEP